MTDSQRNATPQEVARKLVDLARVNGVLAISGLQEAILTAASMLHRLSAAANTSPCRVYVHDGSAKCFSCHEFWADAKKQKCPYSVSPLTGSDEYGPLPKPEPQRQVMGGIESTPGARSGVRPSATPLIDARQRKPSGDALLLTTSKLWIIGDWYQGAWRTHLSRWQEEARDMKLVSAFQEGDITHWIPLPDPNGAAVNDVALRFAKYTIETPTYRTRNEIVELAESVIAVADSTRSGDG